METTKTRNVNKSGIEWTDGSWNTVDGCNHSCTYCYGRLLAKRFGKTDAARAFTPEFHEERLDEIIKVKSGIVFAGSMCDLFGTCVPAEWIARTIGKANLSAATVMFLSKNPARYAEFAASFGPRHWLGATLDAGFTSKAPPVEDRIDAMYHLDYPRKWLSIEPMRTDADTVAWYMTKLDDNFHHRSLGVSWVVLGTKTPERKPIPLDEILNLQDFIGMLHDKGFDTGKTTSPIIKEGAKIGGGVTIGPDVVIGRAARVGFGAVVTRDIPDGETWMGNPARPIWRKRP